LRGRGEWAKEIKKILLELPLAVVERTDLPGLQPARDAVEVEGMLFNDEEK